MKYIGLAIRQLEERTLCTRGKDCFLYRTCVRSIGYRAYRAYQERGEFADVFDGVKPSITGGFCPGLLSLRFAHLLDDEALEALAELFRFLGADGISRGELVGVFDDDREMRHLIERLRSESLLPIVSVRLPSGETVYRIAQDREEFLTFRRKLVARIRSLARSVRGLERAWKWEDPEMSPILERIVDQEGEEARA